MNEEQRKAILELATLALAENNPDSIEIGTAGKGGGIKIYGNYSRPEEFQNKIDAAFKLRAYAQERIGGQNG